MILDRVQHVVKSKPSPNPIWESLNGRCSPKVQFQNSVPCNSSSALLDSFSSLSSETPRRSQSTVDTLQLQALIRTALRIIIQPFQHPASPVKRHVVEPADGKPAACVVECRLLGVVRYGVEEGLRCDFDLGTASLRVADYAVGRGLELRGMRGGRSGGCVVGGTCRGPGIGGWRVGGEGGGYRGGGWGLNGVRGAAVQALYKASLFPAHEYPVLAQDFCKPLLAC